MLYIRLILISLVLTVISWVVLKLIRKPMHIGLVFLFWVVAVVGTTALLYVISVWMATQ